MLYEGVEQRWPSTEELAGILGAVKYHDPDTFEQARDVFSEMVDPQIAYEDSPSEVEQNGFNLAFSEWLLFDFDMGLNTSPLERAARVDASLMEFSTTQFYSRFWVISQDPANDVSVLRDMRTHDDFTVHSHHIAHQSRWAKGTLGVRIACVNDRWEPAGRMNLHDNAASEPGPASAYPCGRGLPDRLAFIDNIEQLYGHKGRLRDTLISVDEYQ